MKYIINIFYINEMKKIKYLELNNLKLLVIIIITFF